MRSERKPSRLQTTRMFSLQLANHDGLFAPREKPRRSFRWLKLAAFFFPAFVAFVFPSFKIGRAILKNPGLQVPESLRQGDLFTLPVGEDDEHVPLISGRTLGFVEGKTPLFIGAALKPFDFEVSFDFNDDDERKNLKGFVPRLKHPTYPIFVKRVHVVADETPPSEERPSIRRETEKPSMPPAFAAGETKAFERHDGNIRLRCWKSPSVEPLPIDPLKPRRNPRLGSLSAAGPGEVVHTGSYVGANGNETAVVVYHGGGLFTRYWGLKELRIPKSNRLNAGQTIGYVHLAPPKQATRPNWQVLMGGVGGPGEIKAQALLELSSRLCDSK